MNAMAKIGRQMNATKYNAAQRVNRRLGISIPWIVMLRSRNNDMARTIPRAAA